MKVFFSPRGGITANLVSLIDATKLTLHVQAYSFTSKEIIPAILCAAARGVLCTVILDLNWKLNAMQSATAFLGVPNVQLLYDPVHLISHNKVMLFDGKTLATGSFNFTEEAEHANAENSLIVTTKAIVDAYDTNFHHHLAHSVFITTLTGPDSKDVRLPRE